MLSDEDEILDLVNGQDEVVGSITHTEVYDHSNFTGRFIRASNGFVINNKGELWIPRRTSHKKIAPNGLDFSMGEHVQAGESYLDGALRGFDEELNLKLQPEDLVYIGRLNPYPGSPYFTTNYVYYSDEEPDYCRKDFVGGEWMKPKMVIDKVQAGDKAKKSLVATIELLLKSKV